MDMSKMLGQVWEDAVFVCYFIFSHFFFIFVFFPFFRIPCFTGVFFCTMVPGISVFCFLLSVWF